MLRKSNTYDLKLLLWLAVMFLMLSFGLPSRSADTTPLPIPPTSETHKTGELINIDYTYTNELITVIYPLFGDILDHFLTVEISNHNPEPVSVIVSSEIQGFKETTTDTVNIDPGETVEVYQNLLLVYAKTW